MTRTSPLRPPVIVLSTGRCGSTTLSNILNLHPRMLSLSEFVSFTGLHPFFHRRPDGRRIWRALAGQPRRTRIMLAGDYDEVLYPFDTPGARFTRDDIPPIMCTTLPHLTDDHHALFDSLRTRVLAQPRQPTADHYRAIFAWLCLQLDRSVWIERSGASLLFASTLLDAFPEARIIHLFRDGRSTALSMSRHYLFQLIAVRLQAFRRLGIDPYRMIAADPAWDRKALRLNLISALLPQRRFDPTHVPPVEEFGRLWTAMIQRSELLLRPLPPERVHRLRFEELCADPGTHLRKLRDFIDPALKDDNWIERASQALKPARADYLELPDDRQTTLTAACRPGLDLLGYSAAPASTEPSPEARV